MISNICHHFIYDLSCTNLLNYNIVIRKKAKCMNHKQEIVLGLCLVLVSGCNQKEAKEVVYASELYTVNEELTFSLIIEDPFFSRRFTNHSDSKLFNWITESDCEHVIVKDFQLNAIDEAIDEINANFKELFEIFKATNESGHTTHVFDSYFYCIDNFCTLITKNARVDFYKSCYLDIYNINKETKTILSNDELIDMYGMEKEEVVEILHQKMLEMGIQQCRTDETIKNCYFKSENFMLPEISENSKLYVNELGELEILIFVFNPDIAPYNGEVSNYIPISLTK